MRKLFNNMPFYSDKTIKKVAALLKSGKVNYWTGNECKKFEKEFSNYIGNKYAITLSNGSVAMELTLKVLNLKNMCHLEWVLQEQKQENLLWRLK